MTINERIQLIVDELFNGNKARFATSIEIPQTTVSNVLTKRKSNPSADFLEAIANSIESLDLRWLLTGSGEMLDRGQNYSNSFLHLNPDASALASLVAEPPGLYQSSEVDKLKNAIIEKDRQIQALQKDKEQLVSDKDDLRSDKQRLLDELYDLKALLGRTGSQVENAG